MQSDGMNEIEVHRDVLQAEGFVALQLGADLDVAAEVMQMYAAAEQQDLPRVARDVLDGRLTFGRGLE